MLKNSHKKDLKKKFLNWFSAFWPIFVITSVVLAFFYPVWLKGLVPLPADIVVGSYYPWLDYKWGYPTGVPVKNPITSDAISFSYPMRMLAIDLLKDGQWPLWNPYILFGTPLLANLQFTPFSPTNFVYFIFDKLNAWSIQIMLQHILAVVFTYILLRHWKVSKIASIFGGIIFAFSGFNLIWSQWNAHSLSAAFIPLLLFFADRWLKEANWFDGVGISLTLTSQVLAGYPQIIFYSAIALVIIWVFRALQFRIQFYKTVLLGVFAALGFGLAAPQVLPGYELLQLSQRQTEAIPFEWAFLSWEQIITFVAPDYFGNHATGNYWGPKNYTSNVGFIGVTSLALVGFGLYLWKKSSEIKILSLLALVGLILAFPNLISVSIWKSGFLAAQASTSHKSLVLFVLATSGLTAFGLDYIRFKKVDLPKAPLVAPAILLIIFGGYAAGILVFGGKDEQVLINFKVALRNLVVPTAAFGFLFFQITSIKFIQKFVTIGILGISLFELFYFGWKFTPFSPRHIIFPKTPIIEFLTNGERPFRIESTVIPVNLLMPYKIEIAGGYDALYPESIAKLIAIMNSGDIDVSPQDRYGIISTPTLPLLDLLNVRYLLIRETERNKFDKDKYELVFKDKSTIALENKRVLPRAFMIYNQHVTSNRKELLQRLLSTEFDFKNNIIVEEPILQHTGGGPGLALFTKYSAQESIIDVETQTDGLLFVSDTWHPGWKAYVDGKETKIYRANFAFRAVLISEGKHTVKFIYRPESFYKGLKIALLSLIAITVSAFLVSWKSKKPT